MFFKIPILLDSAVFILCFVILVFCSAASLALTAAALNLRVASLASCYSVVLLVLLDATLFC